MAETVKHGGLTVAKQLYEFVNTEALPGTGVEPDVFWAAADDIIHKFSPKIASALRKRKSLQNKINRWHKQNAGQAIDPAEWNESHREAHEDAASGLKYDFVRLDRIREPVPRP